MLVFLKARSCALAEVLTYLADMSVPVELVVNITDSVVHVSRSHTSRLAPVLCFIKNVCII